MISECDCHKEGEGQVSGISWRSAAWHVQTDSRLHSVGGLGEGNLRSQVARMKILTIARQCMLD